MAQINFSTSSRVFTHAVTGEGNDICYYGENADGHSHMVSFRRSGLYVMVFDASGRHFTFEFPAHTKNGVHTAEIYLDICRNAIHFATHGNKVYRGQLINGIVQHVGFNQIDRMTYHDNVKQASYEFYNAAL